MSPDTCDVKRNLKVKLVQEKSVMNLELPEGTAEIQGGNLTDIGPTADPVSKLPMRNF